jgi:hypothetical protein
MGDAFDCRNEHWGIRRVADFDVVVDDHAVLVVDDLCLVTELDGLAESSLADGMGVGVVQ